MKELNLFKLDEQFRKKAYDHCISILVSLDGLRSLAIVRYNEVTAGGVNVELLAENLAKHKDMSHRNGMCLTVVKDGNGLRLLGRLLKDKDKPANYTYTRGNEVVFNSELVINKPIHQGSYWHKVFAKYFNEETECDGSYEERVLAELAYVKYCLMKETYHSLLFDGCDFSNVALLAVTSRWLTPKEYNRLGGWVFLDKPDDNYKLLASWSHETAYRVGRVDDYDIKLADNILELLS